MPVFDGELGRHDAGSQSVRVSCKPQKVSFFLAAHGSQTQVVEHEDLGSGGFFHDF
jgi:hypothetical protein